MQVFARRVECKHLVWAGPLVDTAATLNLADELRGRSCPTCGDFVRDVEFVAIKNPTTSSFDEPPAPRNAENKLATASNADRKKTRQRLAGLGAQTTGLAADLKEAALGLTPPRWRATLAKLPVGILHTYEPNAECILFNDSAMPAIVFHQGLAGYLFKMNRSIFPLVRMGSISGQAIRIVEDEKIRSSLRVQAVDTALEFLGIGKPRSKVLVEIPAIAMNLEMPLTRTMAAFVLCHEYGHAVLNHADELRSIGRDSQFYLLERSRAMEFEADTWGQDAVIGAFTGGKDLEPSLAILDELFSDGAPELRQDISHAAPCVALLYFEFLDVIEQRLARHGIDVTAKDTLSRRRVRMAGKNAPEHSMHPSNKERFQALYAHLSEHSNYTTHTWVEGFEVLLDEIKDDLDKLIDKTGAVAGKRLTRRFPWPWSKAKRGSSSWRDTVTSIDDDDDTRIALQKALQNVEGSTLKLDEAELWRRFEQQRDQAEAHYQREEYAEAEKIYTRILDAGETTESVPLYFPLGDCREKLGDQQGAIAAYRRCLEVVPDSDFAAMCGLPLGRILLFEEKDPIGAEPALTAATRLPQPDLRALAMFWLGTIAHGRGDVEAALRRYRDVYAFRDSELTLLPWVKPRAALNIGGVLEERGQFVKAAKMFEYARDHRAIEPENRAIAEQHLRAVRSR